MGKFLGPCSSGDDSFILEATHPEYYETATPGGMIAYSDVAYVKSGIWSVSYVRTVYSWSGASHTFDIYHTTVLLGIDDGESGIGYGARPGAHYNESTAFWPCDSGSLSSVVAAADFPGPPGSGDRISYNLDLEDVSGNGLTCSSSILFDLGCPNCIAAPVRLVVQAGLNQTSSNSYSFKITATGTFIG